MVAKKKLRPEPLELIVDEPEDTAIEPRECFCCHFEDEASGECGRRLDCAWLERSLEVEPVEQEKKKVGLDGTKSA